MARQTAALYALNGGEVSRLALTRVDLNQVSICGEVVENWLVSTLGWIGLRPGTRNNGPVRNNQKPQYLRFVGTASTCSLLELTPNTLRVWNDDALVVRDTVTTSIVNGDFSSLGGWTTVVAPGGQVAAAFNAAFIRGSDLSRSRLTQAITVPPGSAGKEHGLRIQVDRGPVQLKIGTASGTDDIVAATELAAGTHSIAVVLSGTVYLDFSTDLLADRVVKSVAFESPGVMELPTPWFAPDIGRVRYDQQGDVLFCAARSARQHRIESRSRRSWSVVEYIAMDGPFLAEPVDPTVLTPSGTTGDIEVFADRATFKPSQAGAIFEITHSGQSPKAILSGQDQYSEPIRVTGVDDNRKFTVFVSGTFVGKVKMQQAIGAPEAWQDYENEYTAPTIAGGDPVDDDYDNTVAFYRLGFKGGDYTSGVATVQLVYSGGTTVGVFRQRFYISPTHIQADVIKPIGTTAGSSVWREGSWSDLRGWPRDVAFQDGRIWWIGKSLLYGSVSDDFASYDDSIEGNSSPVVRSIATGPADGNIWILRLFRLIVASATSITGIRSSSLDEPITRTAFTARDIDQLGAADLAPAAVGGRGVYVGRSNIDLFEIVPSTEIGDYAVSLLNRLNPDITAVGIVKIAVQRRPEPRIWCVLADGTMAILTYNREEKVVAWQSWKTDGFVEECEILPNVKQDDVFLCVNRFLNGSWTRRMERCSYEADAVGNVKNEIADCARKVINAGALTTLSGLSDFNGKTVAVWTPSRRGYRVPVTAGVATIPEAVTEAWVGLPYGNGSEPDARFKSTKMAYAADLGTALLQKKRIDHLGLAFDTTARIGVRVGRSFDRMDALPIMREGAEIDPNMVEDDVDETPSSFNGEWKTDSRFCIAAQAPWPCRVKAVTASITTHDSR